MSRRSAMSGQLTPKRELGALRLIAVLAVGLVSLAACGTDDSTAEVPDPSELSAYSRAIVTSSSHDEVIFAGGDMVVAVACTGDDATATVTAVATGLGEGTYVGVVEPSTGVDITLQVSLESEAVAAAQMQLDATDYVITFDDIDGAVFEVSGC